MARTEEIRARWCCLEDRAVPLVPIEGPHPAEDVKHLLSRVERLEAVVKAAREHRERIRQFCARISRAGDDDGPEDVMTAAQGAQERFKRAVDDYEAWQKFEGAVDALEADDGE
jgi:hypothetical protein